MKQVVLKKQPVNVIDFDRFDIKSAHVIMRITFKTCMSYYYTPTKIARDQYCLVNISFPGGVDTNDSCDLKIWANPRTMLRDFLESCPDQKSMFVFANQTEMFNWLAKEPTK